MAGDHNWAEYAEKYKNAPPTDFYQLLHHPTSPPFLPQKGKHRALLLGPGGGQDATMFAQSGLYKHIDVIDIEPHAIELTRRALRAAQFTSSPFSFRLLAADIVSFFTQHNSLGGKTYDVIYACRVFPFVFEETNAEQRTDGMQSIFRTLFNLLSPGGVFAFSLFGKKHEWSETWRTDHTELNTIFSKKTLGHSCHLMMFKEEFEQIHSAAGKLTTWHEYFIAVSSNTSLLSPPLKRYGHAPMSHQSARRVTVFEKLTESAKFYYQIEAGDLIYCEQRPSEILSRSFGHFMMCIGHDNTTGEPIVIHTALMSKSNKVVTHRMISPSKMSELNYKALHIFRCKNLNLKKAALTVARKLSRQHIPAGYDKSKFIATLRKAGNTDKMARQIISQSAHQFSIFRVIKYATCMDNMSKVEQFSCVDFIVTLWQVAAIPGYLRAGLSAFKEKAHCTIRKEKTNQGNDPSPATFKQSWQKKYDEKTKMAQLTLHSEFASLLDVLAYNVIGLKKIKERIGDVLSRLQQASVDDLMSVNKMLKEAGINLKELNALSRLLAKESKQSKIISQSQRGDIRRILSGVKEKISVVLRTCVTPEKMIATIPPALQANPKALIPLAFVMQMQQDRKNFKKVTVLEIPKIHHSKAIDHEAKEYKKPTTHQATANNKTSTQQHSSSQRHTQCATSKVQRDKKRINNKSAKN